MDDKTQIKNMINHARERFVVESAEGISDEDIAEFLKAAYSSAYNAPEYADREKVLARWRWINRENPNVGELGFPGWFCKDRSTGELAGHLAYTPLMASVGGTSCLAVWARDLIVLKKWRKSGVFALLFHVFMESVRKRAAFTMLGGAPDHVVARYKKLGFVHLGYLPLYVYPLSCSRILQRYRTPKILAHISGPILQGLLKGKQYLGNMGSPSVPRDVAITRIHECDASFDVFWEKVAGAFPVIIKRDSVYLKWRFLNNPFWHYEIFKAERKGELLGYIVLREGLSKQFPSGVISDILAHPDDQDTIRALIRFAQTYFSRKKHLELVRCDILHSRFERQLRKQAFMPVHSTASLLVGNTMDGTDRGGIFERDNWFMDYSDSDFDLWGRRPYPSSTTAEP